MRLLIHAFLAIALLTGCKALPEPPKTLQSNAVNPVSNAEKQAPNAVNQAANTETQAAKPGDPLRPLEKDGSPKSSFPAGVVERLNAITTRSKTAIDQFDKIRPGLKQASKTGKVDLAELTKLHEESKAAMTALGAEGKQLLDSRQYYNSVIFSGMALFAEKVEKELQDEIKALSAASSLSSRGAKP